MSKGKKALVVISLIILIFICAGSCFISLRPAGIKADSLRFGIYGCYGDDSGIVPSGSIVITDRNLTVGDGTQAAVFTKNGNTTYPILYKSAFIGTAKMQGGKFYLVKNTGEKIELAGNDAEYIVYSIAYVGSVFWLLYRFRYLLWGAWLCVFALIIVLIATAPARRHKKYKKQLIETFKFYGEKYDKEDEDKDY